MDMNQLDKMRGMPAGFPFAMILLGVICGIASGILASIDARFFTTLANSLNFLSVPLIEWGAILQGVLWICGAFAKKSGPPT